MSWPTAEPDRAGLLSKRSSRRASLLYNPSRDEASALNRTATEAWSLCDGRLTLTAIAGVLGERYGVSDAMLLDDVARVLVALRVRGLIEFLPGSPQS